MSKQQDHLPNERCALQQCILSYWPHNRPKAIGSPHFQQRQQRWHLIYGASPVQVDPAAASATAALPSGMQAHLHIRCAPCRTADLGTSRATHSTNWLGTLFDVVVLDTANPQCTACATPMHQPVRWSRSTVARTMRPETLKCARRMLECSKASGCTLVTVIDRKSGGPCVHKISNCDAGSWQMQAARPVHSALQWCNPGTLQQCLLARSAGNGIGTSDHHRCSSCSGSCAPVQAPADAMKAPGGQCAQAVPPLAAAPGCLTSVPAAPRWPSPSGGLGHKDRKCSVTVAWTCTRGEASMPSHRPHSVRPQHPPKLTELRMLLVGWKVCCLRSS